MDKEGVSKVKLTVIIGYVLVVIVLIAGLSALYKNIVDYSDKRIRSEDLSELFIVGNTLSMLYEIESEQNLLTPSSANLYYINYDSIIPYIEENLYNLYSLSQDSLRKVRLDTINFLIKSKRDNLNEIVLLLDSIREAPQIVRETHSSYESKRKGNNISDYLDYNVNSPSVKESDTIIIAKERKGFFERLRNAFVGKPDSTIVIENRSGVNNDEIKLIIDTVVNRVRYSERLDMSRHVELQSALVDRQIILSNTNRMLTARINDLLKDIEQEEIRKSIQLFEEKEYTLSRSQKIMLVVSVIAILIALLFAVLLLIDINKSQRYKSELEKSNLHISQLLDSRRKLMLTISHDIKAPVSSILGFIELMKDNLFVGLNKEKSIKYLQNMRSSANHVMQLVTTLLDYSKLQEGDWQFSIRKFNLHHLVNVTASSFKPIAEQKDLAYYLDNTIPTDKIYESDPYVLRQIISNIISNAIKYTNSGEIRIVAKENSEGIFFFSVADTGVGIDINDQKFVFNEFKQVGENNNLDYNIEGSGLGLAITKRLVSKLDGEIKLTSEQGVGSEFVIEIPLKGVSSLPDTSNTHSQVNLNNPGSISVLVIDDDPTQLKMVTEMIKKNGMNCTGVSDPDKVLFLLKNNFYNILFVDINLQVTTGIKLVKEIFDSDSNLLKDIPIIALSADSDIRVDELQAFGFADFLPKPFISDDLFRMINFYTNAKVTGNKESNTLSYGVKSLIEYVKDDIEQSSEILQSFIDETNLSKNVLREAIEQNDYLTARNISHKMIPLIKMIGDNEVIGIVEHLESGSQLSKDKVDFIISELNRYISEAKQLKAVILQSVNGGN